MANGGRMLSALSQAPVCTLCLAERANVLSSLLPPPKSMKLAVHAPHILLRLPARLQPVQLQVS